MQRGVAFAGFTYRHAGRLHLVAGGAFLQFGPVAEVDEDVFDRRQIVGEGLQRRHAALDRGPQRGGFVGEAVVQAAVEQFERGQIAVGVDHRDREIGAVPGVAVEQRDAPPSGFGVGAGDRGDRDRHVQTVEHALGLAAEGLGAAGGEVQPRQHAPDDGQVDQPVEHHHHGQRGHHATATFRP